MEGLFLVEKTSLRVVPEQNKETNLTENEEEAAFHVENSARPSEISVRAIGQQRLKRSERSREEKQWPRGGGEGLDHTHHGEMYGFSSVRSESFGRLVQSI